MVPGKSAEPSPTVDSFSRQFESEASRVPLALREAKRVSSTPVCVWMSTQLQRLKDHLVFHVQCRTPFFPARSPHVSFRVETASFQCFASVTTLFPHASLSLWFPLLPQATFSAGPWKLSSVCPVSGLVGASSLRSHIALLVRTPVGGCALRGRFKSTLPVSVSGIDGAWCEHEASP